MNKKQTIMMLNDFNERYGLTNRLITFHPASDGTIYGVERIDGLCILTDTHGNILSKDVKITKGSTYSHNMIIEETKHGYSLVNSFKFNMNVWNFARFSLEYYIKNYNGIFLGNLSPNSIAESIASDFLGQKAIPVCLFDATQGKGEISRWEGNNARIPYCKSITDRHNYVMFFRGNDDASYYAHFKSIEEAMDVWNYSRLNDNKMPQEICIPKKEKNAEEYCLLQTEDEIVYYHEN